MIKCLIFDCDGTLVDSEYLCNLGLQIKLQEYGVERPAENMMKRFRGPKLANILESLETDHRIKFSNDFVPSYRLLVDELFSQRLQPCDGVHEMLLEIELPRCVASSGPLEKIQRALSLTGLSKYFNDSIFSSYVIGSWKPNPGLFLHAAKEMGFQPKECAVIEDSLPGIKAAKAAGMVPVLYDPGEIYASIEGVKTIQHMNQLKGALWTKQFPPE